MITPAELEEMRKKVTRKLARELEKLVRTMKGENEKPGLQGKKFGGSIWWACPKCGRKLVAEERNGRKYYFCAPCLYDTWV